MVHDHDHDDGRFSELPERVIHHIMKLLPRAADATRMSVLSKKHFSAWCSFPVLDFCFPKVTAAESASVHYSLQHLTLNNNPLERLKFMATVTDDDGVSFESDALELLYKLTNFALDNKVKELDLCIWSRARRVPLGVPLSESIFSAKSVTNLQLSGLRLEVDPDQHITLISFPLIESFGVTRCTGLTSLTLCGAKLKVVRLVACVGLEKIDLDGSTSLESLTYGRNRYCEINIASTKSVKALTLSGINVTDKWMKSSLSRFVESLLLQDCYFPVQTRWYLEHLKVLRLNFCEGIVEFQTPNLERFVYAGPVWCQIPGIIKSSSRLEVDLDVDFEDEEEYTIARFTHFIRRFSHCQTLSLVSDSVEKLIYPKAMRPSLLPPLYDMKHLKVILHCEVEKIVELIDSLLWLGPRPNTISIMSMEKPKAVKTIKFYYHDGTSNCVCKCWWICQCWQHLVKGVAFDKFEDGHERTSLQAYFLSTYNLRCQHA